MSRMGTVYGVRAACAAGAATPPAAKPLPPEKVDAAIEALFDAKALAWFKAVAADAKARREKRGG